MSKYQESFGLEMAQVVMKLHKINSAKITNCTKL